MSHSAHDFCIIGPRGCGKSRIVERLAEILGMFSQKLSKFKYSIFLMKNLKYIVDIWNWIGNFEAKLHQKLKINFKQNGSYVQIFFTQILQRLYFLISTQGYDLEPIMLYQDMTARDLLQQRTTLANGDTVKF